MKARPTSRPAPAWCPDDLITPPILHQLTQAGKVVDGRPNMAEVVCDKLRDTIGRGARMVVFIDGPPGTGKTGQGDRIEAKVVEEGIVTKDAVLRLPLDLCLKTERGSDERTHLRDNAVNFWRDFMDYREVKRIFAEALAAIESEEKQKIHIPRAYKRTLDGKHAEHDISVNPDTALLLVEGVRSIPELFGPDGLPQWLDTMAIMMHTTAREALIRATLRDMLNGRNGTTFAELLRERIREYGYIGTSLRSSIARADFICKRFPKRRDFMDSLVRKDEEVSSGKAKTRFTVKQVLGGIEPDLLAELFPEGLPDVLRIGSLSRVTATS